MTLPKIRRKLNDSKLGRILNGSIPGILVEGASRSLSDAGRKIGDYAFTGMAFGSALLTARKRPLTALALAGLGTLTYLDAQTPIEIEDAETHYSHTSRLYKKTRDKEGNEIMKRIPVGRALKKEITSYILAEALFLSGLKYNSEESRWQ